MKTNVLIRFCSKNIHLYVIYTVLILGTDCNKFFNIWISNILVNVTYYEAQLQPLIPLLFSYSLSIYKVLEYIEFAFSPCVLTLAFMQCILNHHTQFFRCSRSANIHNVENESIANAKTRCMAAFKKANSSHVHV